MSHRLRAMKIELEKAELELDHMQQLVGQKTHFLDQKIEADLKRRDVYLSRHVYLEDRGARIQEQQAAIRERKSLWRHFRRIYSQRTTRLPNETQQAYDERTVYMNEERHLLERESIQRTNDQANLTLEKWELMACWMQLLKDERDMNRGFDELYDEVLVLGEDERAFDLKRRVVDRMRAAYEDEVARVIIEGMDRLAQSSI